ncbi:MAG: MFS transporter [Actinomycetota bacterium]|nr:MFS transporter [Actinomycetota bacterium]
MTAPSVLKRNGFVKLFVGQGISSLGDWMATVAFIAITHAVTDSPTAIGGILVLRLLPGAVAGPLAGRAAQRFGYRKTMLAMDLARAAMIAVVPFVFALWWIYLWAFLIEVAGLLFLPARDSSIPELVDAKEAAVANSFILGSSYGTIPLGAGLFALFFAVPAVHMGGVVPAQRYAFVFWADALTFIASFEFIRRINELRGKSPDLSPEGDAKSPAFHEAFRIPLVRKVLAPTAAIVLGLGALFSLGIVFVENVLGASQTQFGVLIALFGVGAMAGLGLTKFRPENRLADMRLGVMLCGSMIIVVGLAPSLLLAFIGSIGFGAGVSYALASGMTYLQQSLRGEERVLAFTAFHILIRAGLGLGAIGAGLAGQLIGAVDWPVVGSLEPARVVLSCSGALGVLSAYVVQQPAAREQTTTA